MWDYILLTTFCCGFRAGPIRLGSVGFRAGLMRLGVGFRAGPIQFRAGLV